MPGQERLAGKYVLIVRLRQCSSPLDTEVDLAAAGVTAHDIEFDVQAFVQDFGM